MAGIEQTLVLHRANADMMSGKPGDETVSGAQIYSTENISAAGGNITAWTPLETTGSNGSFTFKFDKKGDYVIAAPGSSVSAPGICRVTVLANPVLDTENKIAAIGTVTLESKPAIDTARNAYNSLTEEQKAFVANYQTLVEAEAAYAHLLDSAAAKAVDEAVANLAPVTLESKNAIEEARKAFDALTPAQKELLAPETESKLKAAEAEYARLVKEAADKAAAKEVENKIARLQPVTKDSGEAIKDARNSYEALTPEQKNFVSKDALDALVKAEKMFDMIQGSNKPGTLPGGKTDGSSSGVIKISATGTAKGEKNPNTGAPAMSIAPAMLVLAAAALVLKKRG